MKACLLSSMQLLYLSGSFLLGSLSSICTPVSHCLYKFCHYCIVASAAAWYLRFSNLKWMIVFLIPIEGLFRSSRFSNLKWMIVFVILCTHLCFQKIYVKYECCCLYSSSRSKLVYNAQKLVFCDSSYLCWISLFISNKIIEQTYLTSINS